MAIGILVVPELSESQKTEIPGNRYPEITPMNMPRNIHSVRNLSKKDNLLIFDAIVAV